MPFRVHPSVVPASTIQPIVHTPVEAHESQKTEASDVLSIGSTDVEEGAAGIPGAGQRTFAAKETQKPVVESQWSNVLVPLGGLGVALLYGVASLANASTASLGSAGVMQAAFLISAARSSFLFLVVAFLRWKHPRRSRLMVNLSVSSLLVMGCITLTNLGGMLFFLGVAIGSTGVSLSVALVGLYTCAPAVLGMVYFGEQKTLGRIFGIVVGILTVVCVFIPMPEFAFSIPPLLTPTSSTPTAPLPPLPLPRWTSGLFLGLAAIVWAATDTISSRVGRNLSTIEVALFGAIAHALFAVLLSILLLTSFSYLLPATPSASTCFTVLTANMCGIAGWLLFVTLGRSADASHFAPIAAMYPMISAIGSFFLLGEEINATKILAIALAGTSVVLTAMGGGKPPSAGIASLRHAPSLRKLPLIPAPKERRITDFWSR